MGRLTESGLLDGKCVACHTRKSAGSKGLPDLYVVLPPGTVAGVLLHGEAHTDLEPIQEPSLPYHGLQGVNASIVSATVYLHSQSLL